MFRFSNFIHRNLSNKKFIVNVYVTGFVTHIKRTILIFFEFSRLIGLIITKDGLNTQSMHWLHYCKACIFRVHVFFTRVSLFPGKSGIPVQISQAGNLGNLKTGHFLHHNWLSGHVDHAFTALSCETKFSLIYLCHIVWYIQYLHQAYLLNLH